MTSKRESYCLDSSEEDGGHRHQSRSQRYIFLAVGAVLVLGAIVIAGAIIGSAKSSGPTVVASRSALQAAPGRGPSDIYGDRKPFSLEEVLGYSFSPRTNSDVWISDDEMMQVGSDGVNLKNVLTNVRTSMVPVKVWEKLIGANDPKLSSNRQYVLIKHNSRKVFRYSSLSRYSVYDIRKGSLIPINVSGERQQFLQYVAWIPGRSGLVIVYRNDIYVRPLVTAPHNIRITNNGHIDQLFNGIPDWVYEEEIIGSDSTLWMSKDGGYMAFASFNDTLVDIMPINLYGQPGQLLSQYPATLRLRYPKAGRTNPTVALYFVNLRALSPGNMTVTRLTPPAELAKQDHILARVGWKDERSLSATWLSRVQDRTIISLYSIDNNDIPHRTELLDHRSPDATWNDIEEPPIWLEGSSSFLTLLPALTSSGHGHFKHVHVVEHQQRPVALTSGEITVTEILHHDPARHLVYFVAAPADHASERHLYVTSDNTNSPLSRQQCITCNTTTATSATKTGPNNSGGPCIQNSFSFSTEGGHFVWTCEGPLTVPRVTLHRTGPDMQTLYVLEDNNLLARRLRSRKPRRMMSVSVKVAEGMTANVRLMLPPNLDHKSYVKYPMLVFTYGGPDSQVVSGRFSVGWPDHLVTQRDIIYAMIDGRGSGFRGDRLRHAVFRKLGQYEVYDQINVTRKLQETYSFIDANRTAIWGWSYGGFVSAMALAQDSNNVFRCGISVAPVTNWIYYDTMYTERYMGLPTPDDNLDGYDRSDINRLAVNFLSKQFLLIHGTADDNVHYQQSLMLARSLELEDILFSQQTYTDEDHSLGLVRLHHYHTMERFLEACFNLPLMRFHRKVKPSRYRL